MGTRVVGSSGLPLLSILSILLVLSSAACCCRTTAPGVCSAESSGIGLLVLLSESPELLPLRSILPERMDEGGARHGSTRQMMEGLEK